MLLPDIMGLRPLFDEHCARLAHDNNWNVCSFELFADNAHLDRDERMVAAKDLDDGRILGDALAAADATQCERVNIIGFCMGGMYTLKSVRTGRFHRHVPFYGMIHVPDDWRGEGQGDPLDAVRQGDPRRVLAVIGTADPFTPMPRSTSSNQWASRWCATTVRIMRSCTTPIGLCTTRHTRRMHGPAPSTG